MVRGHRSTIYPVDILASETGPINRAYLLAGLSEFGLGSSLIACFESLSMWQDRVSVMSMVELRSNVRVESHTTGTSG